MAKELTIRIKIHHGQQPLPAEEQETTLVPIIAKVIAAAVIIISIIIMAFPKNEVTTEDTLTEETTLQKQTTQVQQTVQSKFKPEPQPALQAQQPFSNNATEAKVAANLNKKSAPLQGMQPSRSKTTIANLNISAQFTSGINKLKPIDNLGSNIYPLNDKSVSTVYYYTVINNQKGKRLTHRWIYNGKTLAKIASKITQQKQIMYSSKRITKKMSGGWRVEIIDQSGKTLQSNSFTFISK
ncbi:MAG: DUF2914 domain-containing protein [Gammaproteobacteria bacterium]|nr:MAG: DUF2914 domain-containing protein [Gammaproteobacteria bacterium]